MIKIKERKIVIKENAVNEKNQINKIEKKVKINKIGR